MNSFVCTGTSEVGHGILKSTRTTNIKLYKMQMHFYISFSMAFSIRLGKTLTFPISGDAELVYEWPECVHGALSGETVLYTGSRIRSVTWRTGNTGLQV